MINHRSQGVVEEISETQQTVLVNRSKIRVRSIKGHWLDLIVKI
jgi:hypothetical protein